MFEAFANNASSSEICGRSWKEFFLCFSIGFFIRLDEVFDIKLCKQTNENDHIDNSEVVKFCLLASGDGDDIVTENEN
jgi:hypothetical protein